MKIRTTISALLLTLIIGIGNAQDQGEIRLQASISRGADLAVADNYKFKKGSGLTIGGEYFLKDGISLAPSYTHFFETKGYTITGGFSNRRTFKAGIFNVDVRYYFPLWEWLELDTDIQIYGVAGLAFYNHEIVQSGRGTIDIPNGVHTKSGNGINLGIGALYPIDNVTIFAQYKHQSPVQGRMIFDLGVGFMFGY